MTVIADATSTIRTAIPPKSMLPYDDHFHPIVSKSSNYSSMPENKRIGTPFVAVDIKPLAKQVGIIFLSLS
jgi:transcription factor 1